VLSAFCIGVLNSHHRFFLSYAAPVLSSAAIVAALIVGGRRWHLGQERLAVVAAWGAVAGSGLQLAVQVPRVLALLGGTGAFLRSLGLGRGDPHVAEVVRNFLPVVAGRGVVQLSAYVDQVLASLLPVGTVAALGFAQTIYTLPVSLFGMAVSAAALPSMSTASTEQLRAQLGGGLRSIAFTVIPSVVAFLAFGDVLTSAFFQSGAFRADAVRLVWLMLGGSTVGLLATTLGRLYANVFYALRDTRTPLGFAALRVALTAGLGWFASLHLPRLVGLPAVYGAVGLTASAGVAGWVEFVLLRRGVHARIGKAELPAALLARRWGAAALAGGAGLALRIEVARLGGFVDRPWPRAVVVLGVYGLLYLGGTLGLGVAEARDFTRRFTRRLARR
jgi:putative peptidoglycan lipid II flippase